VAVPAHGARERDDGTRDDRAFAEIGFVAMRRDPMWQHPPARATDIELVDNFNQTRGHSGRRPPAGAGQEIAHETDDGARNVKACAEDEPDEKRFE